MNNKPNAASAKLFGIDVSHFNTVDWARVKKVGAVQFVFIKASEGLTLVDDKYADNIKQARALSIPPGPYHFFIPTSSVADQVKNFVSTVGKLEPGDLPPVLDCEVPSRWFNTPEVIAAHQAAWLTMTVDQRVAKIEEWMTAVKLQLGVTPILYASPTFIRDTLGGSPLLNKYLLWIAHYGVASPTVPAPFSSWRFWQDSETGTADGVTGKVDTDWFNGTLAELIKLTVPKATLGNSVVTSIRGWFNKLFGWMKSA